MTRKRALLLGIGFTLAAINAWILFGGSSSSVTKKPAGGSSATAAAGNPSTSATPSGSGTTSGVAAPGTMPAAGTSPKTSTPAPALERSGSAAAPVGPAGFRKLMKDKLAEVDDAVHACVKSSRGAGKTLTGTATLFLIAGREKGKVAIESTGTVDDESTIEDDALLGCLHATTRSLAFQIPDDSDSVLAHWKVELKDGEIVDLRPSDFSFRKDSDGPLE